MKKKCKKCGKNKPFDKFYNAKKNHDGKTYDCKECVKAAKQRWCDKNYGYTYPRAITGRDEIT